MGRPKAVRSKDKAPAIDLTKKSSKITFNESDEGDIESSVVASSMEDETELRRSTRKRKTTSNDILDAAARSATTKKSTVTNTDKQDSDDDAPEVMSANNMEVMKLKQQYDDEEAVKPKGAKKRKKPKKLEEEAHEDDLSKDHVGVNLEDMLDDSVFDAVMQYQEALTDEKNDDGANKALNKKSGMGKITIQKEISRKIGSLTVTALDNSKRNSTSAFAVSITAKAFREEQLQNVPRVKFTRFMGQKTTGPAKKFRL